MTSPAPTAPPRTGRTLGLAAAVFGVSWLAWRVSSSLGGAPPWSALGALVIEVLALGTFGLVMWSLWRRPQPAPATDGAAGTDTAAVTTVVRVDCAATDADLPAHLDAVAASLLAARSVGPALVQYRDRLVAPDGGVVVEQFDAAVEPLLQVAHHVDTPWMLVLDAGDVPVPDIVPRLLAADTEGVAVVQGACIGLVAAPGLAARSLTRTVDEGLGARGLARFTGTGAMVRTAALREIAPEAVPHAPTPTLAALRLTVALQRARWQITAPSGPVVAGPHHGDSSARAAWRSRDTDRLDPVRAERVRADEACAARAALAVALRRDPQLTPRHRLGFAAAAVLPLAGVARTLLALVVGATLLEGRLPLLLSAGPVVGLWAPWFVLSAAALWKMSDGSLRPGLRSLDATARVGTSWRGVTTPNGKPITGRSPLGMLFGVDHSAAVAALVGGLSIVLFLRGLSDRLTHTLRPLDTSATVAVLVVALWVLAAGLAHLRLLAVRPAGRRAGRVSASYASTFAGSPALVADITMRGAAVVGPVEATVGEQAELDLVLPTASGCVSARLPVTVRHVRTAKGTVMAGERRIGVEFGVLPVHVRSALAERCVVQPALAALGVEAESTSVVGPDQLVFLDAVPSATPRRAGLRIASLFALVGAVASALAPSAEAAAAAPVVYQATTGDPTAPDLTVVALPTVAVRVDTPSARSGTAVASQADSYAHVTVVCAAEPGGDDLYGTTDDGYTAPRSAAVVTDGRYAVELDGSLGRADADSATIQPGTACWQWVLPAHAARAGTATVRHVVWHDLDLDGTADATEPTLTGVGVALVAIGNDAAPLGVVASQRTDASGMFEFAAVAPGEYRVLLTDVPGGLASFDVLGRSDTFSVAAGDTTVPSESLRGLGTLDLGTRQALLESDSQRMLPAVSTRDVAPAAPASPSPLRWVVPLLTLLIGLPLLLGLATSLVWHRRTGQPGRSISPPLAIR